MPLSLVLISDLDDRSPKASKRASEIEVQSLDCHVYLSRGGGGRDRIPGRSSHRIPEAWVSEKGSGRGLDAILSRLNITRMSKTWRFLREKVVENARCGHRPL